MVSIRKKVCTDVRGAAGLSPSPDVDIFTPSISRKHNYVIKLPKTYGDGIYLQGFCFFKTFFRTTCIFAIVELSGGTEAFHVKTF